MEKYLVKYLLENEQDELRKKYIEFSKIELDWYIYNYGDQISKTHKRNQIWNIKGQCIKLIQDISSLMNYRKVEACKKNVFSSDIYISSLSSEYNYYSSLIKPSGFYNIIGDKTSYYLRHKKSNIIATGTFLDLLEHDYISKWEKYGEILRDRFRQYDFRGAFFQTDQYFESKYFIDIFKDLGVPTFIFVHGLPATYHTDIDNRSDYIMVWGERMKDHYIKAGFNREKVIVVGNRRYSHINYQAALKNNFNDVLVIPPSDLLWHQDTWGEPILMDRSMSILYLYEVEKVLKKLGVNHARYRVHPSVKPTWTYQFLDHDFYSIDKDNLSTSLNKASMVIGSASTMLLDTIAAGVNYIMYEPQEDGRSMLRAKLVPPFDGEDGLEIARTEDDLYSLLKSGYIIDSYKLKGYLEPFNIEIIKKMLL